MRIPLTYEMLVKSIFRQICNFAYSHSLVVRLSVKCNPDHRSHLSKNKKKCKKNRFLYLSWNAAITNVILHDFEPTFQGKLFQMLIYFGKRKSYRTNA